MKVSLVRMFWTTGVIGLLACSSAWAQNGDPQKRVCVISAGTSDDQIAPVYASCWGTGIVLGSAAQFQAHINLELGATLVELERDGRTRVLLLHALPDGQPIVEDLGIALAVSAGRGPLGDIDGLVVDTTGFATDGTITVATGATSEISAEASLDSFELSNSVTPSDSAVGANQIAISPGRINVAALLASDPAVAISQIAE